MHEAGKKPTVFISYSHKDEKDWKDRLVTHLGVLRAQGLIEIWEDRQIEAGADWHKNIQDAMNVASIAVLLISSNSLTSDYILNDEVPPLIERSAKQGVRIFPLVVEPCAWQAVKWLRAMNLRPTDGRPLSKGNDSQIDEDLAALASEIYLIIQSVTRTSSEQTFVPLAPEAVSTSRLPVTGRELFGRELELDMLDGAWSDSNTNVLSLIAWGGVGKSALVNHWLRKMAHDNYRGAEKVYAWSFYRQGTSEQGVSADQFIDAALRWFGDANPTEGSPWDKGERLARLIKRQRTLLLLDGLEPLQFAPGRGQQEGALKDQSMQALLRELAALNPGLCVISSRLPVADLAEFEGDTARRINLEHLSPQAGAEVLKAQGVVGEQVELERASSEFGGHALAVTLLGSYLKNVYGGDIFQRDKVDILKEDEERGGHAERVMASYERWFKEGPELAMLRMLSLFNRPADGQAIDALRTAPGIPSLTDTIQNLNAEDWRRTLVRLRNAKLIADEDTEQPDTLDAHPLVREHFKRQLKRLNPDAWLEGNNRLYEHLKCVPPMFPRTVKDMMPLYAAVFHGCEAGKHQLVFDEVYWLRINKGDKTNLTNLGTFSADLAALSSFFQQLWSQPIENLREDTRLAVMDSAGLCLWALGRLEEAAQLFKTTCAVFVRQGNLDQAARITNNLSAIYRMLGDLKQALGYGRQAVRFAEDNSNAKTHAFRLIGAKVTLADALYQFGEQSQARKLFEEAEDIEREKQKHEIPFLYGREGYQYCDFLLNQGDYQTVQRRTRVTLRRALNSRRNRHVAFDRLSFGRAYLVQAQMEGPNVIDEALNYLHKALNGLREVGMEHHLPPALLAFAELYQFTDDLDRVQPYIDEAMRVATRGNMRLYVADCLLQYARLFVAQGEKQKARESWEKAKEMIEQMGYGRRKKEVEEIERLLEEMAD